MKWTEKDVNAYEGHHCTLCNEFEKAYYTPERSRQLIDRKLCFTCNFWHEQFRIDSIVENNQKWIVTDSYEHYRIGDRITSPPLGFGGEEFIVFWNNKARYTTVTRNLWHQGKIPEHLQKMFEPNAILLTRYEILQKAHFVEILNL